MTNLKEKILEIQKTAQEITAPPPLKFKGAPTGKFAPSAKSSNVPPAPKPAGASRFTAPPGSPNAKPAISAPAVTGSNKVKEMQSAMHALAESVIRDSASSQNQTDKTSKKSFNDFISTQYVSSLDENNKGVAWDANKSKPNTQELDSVMSTFQRIMAGPSEFKIDGNWGFKTDNSLRNIMGFAYALLQLAGDFGLPNNIYQYSNWKHFNELMSGYQVENRIVKLSSEEKDAKAVDLTKHIKAINKLYTHFRQQVISRPEYRPLIEGKRPFDKYNSSGSNKDALTTAEDQLSQSDTQKIENISYAAPALSEKKLNYIPLNALRSKADYLKWMMEYAGNSEEMSVNIFNSTIKPKIESMS